MFKLKVVQKVLQPKLMLISCIAVLELKYMTTLQTISILNQVTLIL